MKRSTLALAALIVLMGVGHTQAGLQFVTNGSFEGGFVGMGVSGPLDGLADSVPIGWTRVETFSGGVVENSAITGFPGNGPSAPGVLGANFQRLAGDNLSGDWTSIQQPLNINVANFMSLTLSLDVMVGQHNLVAGGWVAPAFEWPVVAQINYLDVTNTPQTWRYGWYLNPPGDGPPGPINDPGQGLIPVYNDMLVNPNVWVANSFNLLNQLPQAKTITRIRVGGSGHHFLGNVDNVSLKGTIPEPSSVVVWSLLAALGLSVGWCRRRKRAR
jgi:hypothetical protein